MCCVALPCCLFDLACFFLPSFSSLIKSCFSVITSHGRDRPRDRGERGERGEREERGERGERGEKGPDRDGGHIERSRSRDMKDRRDKDKPREKEREKDKDKDKERSSRKDKVYTCTMYM